MGSAVSLHCWRAATIDDVAAFEGQDAMDAMAAAAASIARGELHAHAAMHDNVHAAHVKFAEEGARAFLESQKAKKKKKKNNNNNNDNNKSTK